MKRTAVRLVPGAAAIAVALAGCGVGGGSSSATETVTQTVTETVDSSDAAEDAEPAEAEPADGLGESEADEGESGELAEDSDTDDNIAPFGETLKRGDGLEVTVSPPESFTPSEWAAGGMNSPEHVRFEVTVKNGTDEAFDPAMLFTTVTSGGAEGDQVFDSENGYDGAPMTTVLPGKSVTYPVGFGVKDSSDVLMEIELDWVGETAIFGTKSALS